MRYFLSALCCLMAAAPGWSQPTCRSAEYRTQQLAGNPALVKAVETIEAFTANQTRNRPVIVSGGSENDLSTNNSIPLITIPVVVHILYHAPAENITDAQVQSQIDVLNADYQKRNPDTAEIPVYYRSLAASCGFRFGLALSDTNGQATSGIVRKYTEVSSFSLDDGIKSSGSGGDDGWDRDKYLNIWVGNLTGGLLGYSSIVGGPKATDGVVVLYTAFGTTGTALAPFNRGRTTTHEVGHWLNMIHTWGDDSCGTDEVADTPPQQAADYGDPDGVIVSCGNAPYGNLYMDYMDFTDDLGMHLFTNGQRDRMRSLFVSGGFRYPLLSSNVPVKMADSAAVTEPPKAQMTAFPNPASGLVTIRFSDPACLGSTFEVYNALGQKMTAVTIAALELQLDVSGWNKGVYFLRVVGTVSCGGGKLVKI